MKLQITNSKSQKGLPASLREALQAGASLYLALMVMTIMLAMALGLSSIFIGQAKTIKQIGNSVIALCAADTGIEVVLLNRSNPVNISETGLSNGATYQVVVAACEIGEDCNFRIKSIGSYLGTRRAIEIIY